MKLIDEAAIEATARVMGESSAAAKALADAKERRARGQTVRFYKDYNSLFVVPVPPQEQS